MLTQYRFGIKAQDGYAFSAPVGQFKPNDFGLLDMHGNVSELCEDWHDPKFYDNSPKINPLNTTPALFRVVRGGNWRDQPKYCRSAHRGALPFCDYRIGFRVVLSSP